MVEAEVTPWRRAFLPAMILPLSVFGPPPPAIEPPFEREVRAVL